MSDPLQPPRKLQASDAVEGFTSGADELDDWLVRFAYQNQRAGNATTYVAVRDGQVIGYYALAMAGVEKKDAPERVRKGGVPQQVPCLLLARLAVDLSEQGAGIGRGLLVAALRRAVAISDEVGVRALLVHARDEVARDFYVRHAEFRSSPTDDLHLFLLLKDVRRAIS